MKKPTLLTLLTTLATLVTLGVAAQDQQPQAPAAPAQAQEAPKPAPPPPPAPSTHAPQATAKPMRAFQELINIDACLSSSQMTDGKGVICHSVAGVTVTAVMKAGVLKVLTFEDDAGHAVTVQIRPDPVPIGRCWTCTSDPATGFACNRTSCGQTAPTAQAPPAAPAQPTK